MPTLAWAMADIYGCGLLFVTLFQHYIRQQTTTVDYKRLINGLVLARFASLQRKTICIMETGKENEIVLYQPDETVRLEVRIQEDSVWLTQQQIADLFGTKRPAITKHLKNIYSSGELDESSTCSILELMGNDGRQMYSTKLRATRTHVHDRFLIIDSQVYHLGASLKDLGRKLFAFSKMGLDKELLMGQVI